uniref:Transposase n=1 Tax=Rhabditophanes sp. KR3021 TaxID=114890 RepID=A0AC35UFX4_9BILA
MNSLSAFDGIIHSDTSMLPFLIDQLGITEALRKKVKMVNEQLKTPRGKQTLFSLFYGQSYGYIGSSRFVYDVENGLFPEKKSHSKNKLENFSLYAKSQMILPYDSAEHSNFKLKIFYYETSDKQKQDSYLSFDIFSF